MKDWKQLQLVAMTPRVRRAYLEFIRRQCDKHTPPVERLYHKYKTLPADIAARLMHLDMTGIGWDAPPKKFADYIAATTCNIKALLEACVPEGTIVDDYIDDTNALEIYTALLKLDADADNQIETETFVGDAK